MKSYLWHLHEIEASPGTISGFICWALAARIQEMHSHFAGKTQRYGRIIQPPIDLSHFNNVTRRYIIENAYEKFQQHVKTKISKKLETHFLTVYENKKRRSRNRDVEEEVNFAWISSKETIETITSMGCGTLIFNILDENKEFCRRFFNEEVGKFFSEEYCNQQLRPRRLEKFIAFYYNNIWYDVYKLVSTDGVVEIASNFMDKSRMDVSFLDRYRLDSENQSIDSHQENFIKKLNVILFSLLNNYCTKKINVEFPAFLSCWSVMNLCCLDSDRKSVV